MFEGVETTPGLFSDEDSDQVIVYKCDARKGQIKLF